MSLFSTTSAAGESSNSSGPKRPEGSTLSIVAVGTTIVGDMETNGVIKIEGKIQGTVRAQGQILIAKGGLVEGDLLTKEAVVGGEVRGTIRAEERVEIQSTAMVHGDIVTPRILIAEGGMVNGAVTMGEAAKVKPSQVVRQPREGQPNIVVGIARNNP